MLNALIESQCKDRLLYPEDAPDWLRHRVGHSRLEQWLIQVWHWPGGNFDRCHDARPWGARQVSAMHSRLYPDAIPW